MCWMRQTHKVEEFKMRHQTKYALHSKFHPITGSEVLSAEDYGHLQVAYDK